MGAILDDLALFGIAPGVGLARCTPTSNLRAVTVGGTLVSHVES
jgi:hypothetical protein